MAKLRGVSIKAFQLVFSALVLVATQGEVGAYYQGHQSQQQSRHLSSHRHHQVNHRTPSQSHFLSPSSGAVRSFAPQHPYQSPSSSSSRFPNLDKLYHKLNPDGGKPDLFGGPTTPSPPLPPPIPPPPRRELPSSSHLPAFMRATGAPAYVAASATARPVGHTTPPPHHRHRHQEDYEDYEDEEDDDEEDEDPGRVRHGGQQDSKVAWDLKLSEDANYQRQQPATGAIGGLGSVGAGDGSLGFRGTGSGTFSEFKWDVLGNRTVMDEMRRRRLSRLSSSEAEIREAIQHSLKVSREGLCKVPRPKVVQVKDVYPHPAKTYMPHCTILHQCGDDTGCCRDETLSCVPRKTKRIELYFYTATLGSGHGSVVEKLVFYNHTECECQDKMEEMMPRDTGKAADVMVRHFRHSSSGGLRSDTRRWTPLTSFRPDRTVEQPSAWSCRCPSLYSVRYPTSSSSGSCSCDCFDKQRECIRAKRGKEYFSLPDRLCIQSEECLPPTCEFGVYIRRAGRCPRKREKFAAWQRYTMDGYK
ncbi:uncharacterized protein [Hetaerina americana]|uniref:uncharacterized protein n=1 Tax=Hetaerina americana TaxID=62018 RepID=UPI003A7F5F64